ncbi:hypothetical protein [Halovivax cerinus]|uniref:Uncharacterized protein n=1 Tax=Halovivax cerinus TaxID=1487865 RepID=A0ABD5NJ82_9EURY|nr:hypothetical protein [Halovivax cerinus]
MSRPRLVPLSTRFVPGLLAVGLFGIFAAVVFGTDFAGSVGYPDGVSITAAIGYSLFDFAGLQESQGVPGTESFLVSFLLIAVVLDAALDASLVLATREGPDESVRPSAFDGPSTGTADRSAESAGADATDGGRTTTDQGETPDSESVVEDTAPSDVDTEDTSDGPVDDDDGGDGR